MARTDPRTHPTLDPAQQRLYQARHAWPPEQQTRAVIVAVVRAHHRTPSCCTAPTGTAGIYLLPWTAINTNRRRTGHSFGRSRRQRCPGTDTARARHHHRLRLARATTASWPCAYCPWTERTSLSADLNISGIRDRSLHGVWSKLPVPRLMTTGPISAAGAVARPVLRMALPWPLAAVSTAHDDRTADRDMAAGAHRANSSPTGFGHLTWRYLGLGRHVALHDAPGGPSR
jgi:hypothetical protein